MTPARRADLAYAAGIGLGLAFLILTDALRVTAEVAPLSDFSGFWAGSHAITRGIDPYDPAVWPAAAASIGAQPPDTPVFGYPPWVALGLVPFGLLPLPLAAALWIWGGVAVAFVAVRALLREALPGDRLGHALVGGSLLIAHPGYQALLNHQWTFLLLAATATCAVALRAGHERAAALVALAWLAKPQLFLFTAVGWGARHRRFGVQALLGAAALVVASWLAMPQWWPAWSTYVAPVRLVQPATLPGLGADLAGAPGRLVGYLLIAAGAVVASRFRRDDRASLAVWSALSIAGAAYAWSYDQLLLIVPLVLASGALRAIDPVSARRLLLAGLGLLLAAAPLLYALAAVRTKETASAVLPATVFVLLVWRLWPLRRASVEKGDVLIA